ncbi:MAG: thermonuclease family protein [Leifsonia sp.]
MKSFTRVRRGFSPRASVALALTATIAVTLSGLAFTPSAANATTEPATVARIVDGDTLDIDTGGLISRVRLLNIDTPELKGADGQPECLAVEATAALAELLPVGSAIQLDYDRVRQDRYGRTLAAVVNGNGVMVDAELARRGLGLAANFGDNTRFLSTIRAAEMQARGAGVGLWDPAVACSPAAVASALEALPAPASASMASGMTELAAVVVTSVALASSADSARDAIAGMGWLSKPVRAEFLGRVDVVADRAASIKRSAVKAMGASIDSDDAEAAQQAAAAKKAAAKQSPADRKKAAAAKKKRDAAAVKAAVARQVARKAAADAEAARIAAEAEAARVAAEAAAAAEAQRAAQAAAEAAARAAAERADAGAASGSGSAGDGGGSTYTGCRNYNGYGMLDTKGRHFAPIPC